MPFLSPQVAGTYIVRKLEHLLEGYTIIPVTGDVASSYTYEQLLELFKKQVMIVSTYDNPTYLFNDTNFKLRCIHDWIHFTYEYGFDMLGEYRTYAKTKEYLEVFLDTNVASGYVYNFLYSEVVVQAYETLSSGTFAEEQVFYEKAYQRVTPEQVLKLIVEGK
jgi:hypothetical protein